MHLLHAEAKMQADVMNLTLLSSPNAVDSAACSIHRHLLAALAHHAGPMLLAEVMELALESSPATVDSHALRVRSSGDGAAGGGDGCWYTLSSLVPEMRVWDELGRSGAFR